MIYGYARVSTKGQAKDGNSLEAQEITLRSAGAIEIYADAFTGTKANRPELDKLLAVMQSGDTMVVTKLDGIARSATQGIALIQSLLDRGIVVHVEWDDELIQALIVAEGHFWHEYVLKGIIPPPDGSKVCDEIIEAYFPSAKSKESITLAGFDEKLQRRDEILDSISKLQEEQKQIEQEVKMVMQDHELADSERYRISWKNIDSTKLDAKRIKEEQPQIYEDYGKVSHYRRFEVKVA